MTRALLPVGYGTVMSTIQKVALAVLGFLVVGGGIMLLIYLLNGGEGDSTDIPGSPEVVRSLSLS
jgi:hypothetical protein